MQSVNLKEMNRYLPLTIWGAALLVIACVLLWLENDFLWKLQEQNLFLDTSLFFKERMVVPGGLLSWLGTYLTQYFYYPWMGVTILCLLWLLLMWLITRTFQLSAQWSALVLVPVGLLLITIVDMGYWVYMLKLQGHVFVATLGTIAVTLMLWCFRQLPWHFSLRALMMVLMGALGYPFFGIYGLAAVLLMGSWSWRLEQWSLRRRVGYNIIALLIVIVVPLMCYRQLYHQINLANIYYAGLPLYVVSEEHHAYYIPYYLLALFFVVMTLVPLKQVKMLKSVSVQVVVLVALVVGVSMSWFRDENYHHELKMQHCIEQNDWNGVLKEAVRQKDEPTRAIVMMRNLALSRLGRQGEDMYTYENGSKAYAAPFGMRLMLVVGPLIYYQYGMLNYSSRLSTEMGVEFGWRAENLKLLAKCALLRHEQQQARKYLRLLKHTTFYGEWADKAQTLPEFQSVKRMMHYDNVLSGDNGNIESFLMNRLDECTDTTDLYFQEQTLLASLWTKNIHNFWYHFSDYVRLHPKARIPRYYQEAAYLYCMIEGREDVNRMPFDESVKQSFNSFAMAAERYDNADVDVARGALQAYRQTYFYDYYLMRQLPEY